MASQDTDVADEVDEAKLAPLGAGEPAIGDPLESSPDANVDSREVLETHEDPAVSPDLAVSQVPTISPEPSLSQDRAMSPDLAMSQDPAESPYQVVMQDPAVSPDPGPYENPQPQNPKGGSANVEGNSPLLRIPFPRRLWMIVEDDAFTSVSWNDAGDTVVINDDLFQREVLCRRGADQIFETNSLKTFISLLNFHGFSKRRPREPSVYHSENNRIMIFRNANFQRNKPQLIDNIKRKGHLMITAWPQTSSTPKKKKQAAAPTRRSLRIQLKQRSKEGDTRAQKTDPNVQGSRDTRSFMSPSYVSSDNMARCAREEPFPSEPAGPSGEGTSGNVRLAPTATATRDVTGEEPIGPPDLNSVMSLYNTCYSIPMAALSATAPPNAPEGEEEEQVEEENSSDYKCALCEHLKTKRSLSSQAAHNR